MGEFNVNHEVLVKLTDHGRKVHRADHHDFNAKYGCNIEYVAPAEDTDGWSKWQLWTLMNEFGPHLSNGCAVPFETTMRIPAPEIDSLQSQLAQAREQMQALVKSESCIPFNGNIVFGCVKSVTAVKLMLMELEQLRDRLAGAMCWIPVAEADLKDGENILVLRSCGSFYDCNYWRGTLTCLYDDDPIADATHILRITPPPSSPAERDV